jgi:hypothetical protein
LFQLFQLAIYSFDMEVADIGFYLFLHSAGEEIFNYIVHSFSPEEGNPFFLPRKWKYNDFLMVRCAVATNCSEYNKLKRNSGI